VKYRAEAARAAEVLRTTVHVIPNGVPLPVLSPRVRQPGDRLIFGTVARLSPQKKLEQLFEDLDLAQDQMTPPVLPFARGAGRGPEEYAGQVRHLARHLPVEWLGEMDDVSGFLAQLDVAVMISEPAGCPNASLEAMAAGLPVLATDVGGAAEQVE